MQMFVDFIEKHMKKPFAAIFGDDKVEPASATATQPVAVIMASSSNPVAYMPANASNIIKGNSDSDQSVSATVSVTAITGVKVPTEVLKAPLAGLVPFTIPHLYWQASVNSTEFPITVKALIDHGSHTVLINEAFVQQLGLKHHKLHNPMNMELAIPEKGIKRVIMLKEWVKLCMYDPTGSWTSKTVCAVIAPSLCAPVILGLLFLAHNNIVIDHAARTAVDKHSGFDLLKPTLPLPPQATRKTLKEFFHELKQNRKLMVTELKMVCVECLLVTTGRMENVQLVDHIVAVCQHIEILNTVDQLNCLGATVTEKYKDIFAPIPHLDELPTDVYCQIKLKDMKQTIST